eukprot:COSAG02_NODE_5031_length_4712_cov_3.859961_2_plen_213_part_00
MFMSRTSLKVGTTIVMYFGESISAEELRRRYPREVDAQYVMQLFTVYVDAACLPEALVRYVNHSSYVIRDQVRLVLTRRPDACTTPAWHLVHKTPRTAHPRSVLNERALPVCAGQTVHTPAPLGDTCAGIYVLRHCCAHDSDDDSDDDGGEASYPHRCHTQGIRALCPVCCDFPGPPSRDGVRPYRAAGLLPLRPQQARVFCPPFSECATKV